MITMLHKHYTEINAEDAFCLLAKTHPPYWHPSGLFQYVCVAANEAVRFSARGFGCALFVVPKNVW